MIPESYLDLLQSTALAHVATIGPHGEPQSTPVWFAWDGSHIRISQTRRQQKYRNLRRDARIALSIVAPQNPYRYLEIRGVVIMFEEDNDRAFVNSLTKKYLGLDEFPWHRDGDEHMILVIEPRHTTQLG